MPEIEHEKEQTVEREFRAKIEGYLSFWHENTVET